ncbi:MAG: DUF5615 family PIN-like protein [Promethearchaeota archaeon]
MKFLVDAMLGKLARFLRIFGYDTVFANDLKSYYNVDPVPDDLLKEYAENNNRIIITKDYPFYKRVKKKIVFLEGHNVYDYLKQLKAKLGLEFSFNMEKARCSECNSPLRRVTNISEISNKLEPGTLKNYTQFYQCLNPKCKKIYWEGSHILDILSRMRRNSIID